jgi:hypothetical protein
VTPYDEFVELTEQIGLPNRHVARVGAFDDLPEQERQAAHHVNDAALIILHVFAFEDFYRHYLPHNMPSYGGPGAPHSSKLKRLAGVAYRAGLLDEALCLLGPADEVVAIRDLYAHGLGRRSGLRQVGSLAPEVLVRYGFETDGDANDPQSRWWPSRFRSFARCVRPLLRAAEWVHANLRQCS